MSSARGYWFDCTPTSPTKPSFAVGGEVADDPVDGDARVGFVDGVEHDVATGKHARAPPHRDQAIDRGQRVRRHGRPAPADDIAVVVIMRRFYENDPKAPRARLRQRFSQHLTWIASVSAPSVSHRDNRLRRRVNTLAKVRGKRQSRIPRFGRISRMHASGSVSILRAHPHGRSMVSLPGKGRRQRIHTRA